MHEREALDLIRVLRTAREAPYRRDAVRRLVRGDLMTDAHFRSADVCAALRAALDDPDVEIRRQVAVLVAEQWRLGAPLRWLPAFDVASLALLVADPDPVVSATARQAQLRPEALPALLGQLAATDHTARLAAARLIRDAAQTGPIDVTRALKHLVDALDDPSPELRRTVVQTLAACLDPRVLQPLALVAEADECEEVRHAAFRALLGDHDP